IDTLLHATSTLEVRFDDTRLEALRLEAEAGRRRRLLLVTAHRRENLGEAMEDIGAAVADLADAHPGLQVVFPLHRNPKVRESVVPALKGKENVILLEP